MNKMHIIQSTQRTPEAGFSVVTREQVYSWMKYDALGSPPTHPRDNDIDMMIASATEFVEHEARRSVLRNSVLMTMSRFPEPTELYHSQIELAYPPFRSLLEFSYYDTQNELQNVSSSDYIMSADVLPPRLVLRSACFWPDTADRPDAVRVRYTAGYDVENESPTLAPILPAQITQAILIGVQLGLDELAVDKRNALETLQRNLLRSYRVDTF